MREAILNTTVAKEKWVKPQIQLLPVNSNTLGAATGFDDSAFGLS
jgi:hypothetical protein